MNRKNIDVEWNGFIAKAVNEHPKEACGFLYAHKPYTDEEYWVVFPCHNISSDPQNTWNPDKNDLSRIRKLARARGLVKIGNVHSHPFLDEDDRTNENMIELVKPSELDLKYAKRFGDVVRIILLVDGKKMLLAHVHDQYGNNIPCDLNQRKP